MTESTEYERAKARNDAAAAYVKALRSMNMIDEIVKDDLLRILGAEEEDGDGST